MFTKSNTTFAILALIVAAPFSAAQSNHPLLNAGEVREAGLTQFWQAQLPLVSGEEIRDGYLIDEALYATTNRGRIFSLKADVGLLRWGNAVTEPAFPIFAPSHIATRNNDGGVIVPTSGEVFVFDRFSGEQRSRFAPSFGIVGPAVGYDQLIFMGGADKNMHLLSLPSPRSKDALNRWEAMAGGIVTTKPLLFRSGTLLFASSGGLVVNCLASDKTLQWTWKAGGAIEASPFVEGNGVYVASMDRSLYKLSLGMGSVIWRARFPSPLQDGPIVSDGLVFQYCVNHGLTAVDTASGKEVWRIPEGHWFASHHKAGDVILTDDYRLLAVDHGTGKIEAKVAAPSVLKAVTNSNDESIYLLGTGGRVACLRLDTEPYLRRQQVLAAQRDLNLSPMSKAKGAAISPGEPVKEPDPLGKDPLRSNSDK
ncbi:MAG: PQQ-binding-like beta-propeller repeat protein [Planctomycetes bacterium]|nr:PQQ-binding-like beta-propeller repeat protein [Planctomycetota bacterium]MBI3833495.1 PQQ-binding-like beta-propeller repeat protein [Planctomycetota bacterium]